MAADDPRHESTAMLVSIGDCQSVVAFTRINGYLFEITDTDPQSRHWQPVSSRRRFHQLTNARRRDSKELCHTGGA
jgi:hypothetical protein